MDVRENRDHGAVGQVNGENASKRQVLKLTIKMSRGAELPRSRRAQSPE